MNLFQKLSNCKIYLYNKEDLSQKKVNKYLIALYVVLISSLFSFSGYTVGRLKKLGNLSHLEKELLECQEELARDDSVLDHIGDRDQMTGIYNRRGFFAAAYDRLKQKFLN